MKEQLISFETAKLAKDKGFDVKTNLVYAATGILEDYNECRFKLYGDYLLVPTQSFLQKWLRETYNRHITIDVGSHHINLEYYYEISISFINTLNCMQVTHLHPENKEYYDSYENALESALQEALKLVK